MIRRCIQVLKPGMESAPLGELFGSGRRGARCRTGYAAHWLGHAVPPLNVSNSRKLVWHKIQRAAHMVPLDAAGGSLQAGTPARPPARPLFRRRAGGGTGIYPDWAFRMWRVLSGLYPYSKTCKPTP